MKCLESLDVIMFYVPYYNASSFIHFSFFLKMSTWREILSTRTWDIGSFKLSRKGEVKKCKWFFFLNIRFNQIKFDRIKMLNNTWHENFIKAKKQRWDVGNGETRKGTIIGVCSIRQIVGAFQPEEAGSRGLGRLPRLWLIWISKCLRGFTLTELKALPCR